MDAEVFLSEKSIILLNIPICLNVYISLLLVSRDVNTNTIFSLF